MGQVRSMKCTRHKETLNGIVCPHKHRGAMGKYVAVWGDLDRDPRIRLHFCRRHELGRFRRRTLGHPRKWCDSNRGGEGVLARQLSLEDETSGGGIAAAVTTT